VRDLQHEGHHALYGVCEGRSGLGGDRDSDAPSSASGRVSADFSPLGLVVGHATDAVGATGCTVVRAVAGGMRCGHAAIGRATGSRELAVATPHHVVDRVDAVLLTGGSAYGLDAAAGVMRWMEEHRRGFPIGGGVVPLVPAAVIFDLAPLGTYSARPTVEMAYAATASATAIPAEGSVGAGTGATVGKAAGGARAMKGGVGTFVVRSGELVVGALVVVNAYGDVRDADGRILCGARADDGTFLDARAVLTRGAPRRGGGPMENTTIGLVATNAALARVELQQLAHATAAAYYRRITPAGTSADGDTVFAVGPHDGLSASATAIEVLAVEAMEAAIERAVRLAKGRDGIPGLADGA
jgi:L-aminopeptidase/D-esterase-like protein